MFLKGASDQFIPRLFESIDLSKLIFDLIIHSFSLCKLFLGGCVLGRGRVDFWFMSWKNKVIMGLIFLFRKRRVPSSLNEHFLIVSTTGLGDTLWATPALRALKGRYPEAKISVLTSRLGKEVLERCGSVDAFYVVSDGLFSFLGPLRKLRRAGVDTALIFHTSQRFALPVCALCGIGRIVGTRGLNKGLDELLTVELERRPCHEIERRLEIVRAVGVEEASPLLEMAVEGKEQSEGLVVGIHPGAKDRFKQYPPEYFVQVGMELKKRLGCQIVVTGGPGEEALVERICARIEGAKPLAGKLTIGELAE